ncbi:MAG: hypothetical protein HHJ13_14765 [Phycicoccus sp.]|nr:hypothetical protein [Phycicoccus sp.]
MRGQASSVLRWPLWSWRNLSITAAALLLVLYGLGRVIGPAKITLTAGHVPLVTVGPTPSEPSPSVSSSAPSSSGAATASGTTLPTSAASGAGGSESVTRVATAFAKAWSSSGRSQQEWTRGIQPFVTPALAAGLAQTDPARVPATRVTGEAVLLTTSATFAQVRLPTDGGSIVVSLSRAGSGPWRVSDVAPAGQPPGAPTPDLHPASPARS